MVSSLTGCVAGFVIGLQLSWDLCSLVWLTTGFSWSLGMIACMLVCVRVEPSRLELRSFRRVALDLARARHRAISSHGFGFCLGVYVCGALLVLMVLLAVVVGLSKGCLPWRCWSTHAWPVKETIWSKPVIHNMTERNISANTTMAAGNHTSVNTGLQSTTNHSNSSVVPNHNEYIEIILHNKTCQGKLVNEQPSFEAMREDSLETCQHRCASSRHCHFVQFEDVEGICTFYEDCAQLRSCGAFCGKTFRYQGISRHKQ